MSQPERVGEDDSETVIRRAGSENWIEVIDVLEGALLDVDAGAVRERTAAGGVFLAEASGSDHVRGALVLSEGIVDDRKSASEPVTGTGIEAEPRVDLEIEIEIEAIGVRRRYRGRGIGRALIDRARQESTTVLLAEFDERVRLFYAALGFRIEPTGDGRFRGRDRNESGHE